MNLQALLEKVQNSPEFLQLISLVNQSSNNKIFLSNLQGSSTELLIAAMFNFEQLKPVNHLIVLNDAEEAAYFHNSLEGLTNALDLFYFPSSFKNRKNFQLLNSSHVMLRTEALTRLSAGGNKKILVTYP
ncbi:MAG: transcription-repair coupling factor, partial [Chitinophagaceae bacterium]